jgi:fructoselysine-6-P-deglycase FrlB-like protein
VVSVSGEAARTVEAARVAASADARVFALTRAGDSSLARVAHEIVRLPEGSRSRRTPHTTDYLLTLLGVAILVEALTGRTIGFLDELPAIIRQSLDALQGPCSEIGRKLAGRERFFILGAGPSFSTAEYGAAKFWESGGLVAFPFDLEEFAHGAHLLTEPGDVLFVVGPNGRSLDRAIAVAREAQHLSASVVHISDQYVEHLAIRSQEMDAVPEEWSPFVTSLPLQWLCWAIASAKSLDVVAKTGRAIDTQVYDSVQRSWIRDDQKPVDR